eukprot:1500377-Prorocentrum_lima.AAC.1
MAASLLQANRSPGITCHPTGRDTLNRMLAECCSALRLRGIFGKLGSWDLKGVKSGEKESYRHC